MQFPEYCRFVATSAGPVQLRQYSAVSQLVHGACLHAIAA
jgi:hypothetical protein